MKLKTKLSLGIGFLFAIIFTLIVFCMFYIGKISNDSENILKDNYNSVMYAKNMSSSIDVMNLNIINKLSIQKENNKLGQNQLRDFDSAKIIFVRNLELEKGNITEVNEKEYVEKLTENFDLYISKSKQFINENPSFEKFMQINSEYQLVRQSIDNIYDVNMLAITNKNLFAKKDADYMRIFMAVVSSICLLLAFGYFWYFPFYVSNSIAYLSEQMLMLLKKLGLEIGIKSNDESFILLKSIDLIDKKMDFKDSLSEKK